MMIALPEQVVCVICVLLQIETDSLQRDDTVLGNFRRGQRRKNDDKRQR